MCCLYSLWPNCEGQSSLQETGIMWGFCSENEYWAGAVLQEPLGKTPSDKDLILEEIPAF